MMIVDDVENTRHSHSDQDEAYFVALILMTDNDVMLAMLAMRCSYAMPIDLLSLTVFIYLFIYLFYLFIYFIYLFILFYLFI